MKDSGSKFLVIPPNGIFTTLTCTACNDV